MYFPKSLDKIANFKIGDCKDFSTATVAMLRALGLKADVALTYRKSHDRTISNIMSTPINPAMPLLDLFNHAIVHVQLADKEVWLDPTNIVSNSRIVYDDIANSPAVVLSSKTTALSHIPESSQTENTLSITKTLKINLDDTADIDGHFESQGEYAKELMEVAIYKNTDIAKKAILSLFGVNPNQNQKQTIMEGLNFKDRLAQKINTNIKVVSEKVFKNEKDKKFLYVPLPDRLMVYVMPGKDRVSDFYVGSLGQETVVTKINGYDYGPKNFGCVALTPWYRIERKLIKTPEGFEVHDQVNFLKSTISASDINSELYSVNLSDIQHCAMEQEIQVTELDPKTDFKTRTAGFTEDAFENLTKITGTESIDAILRCKNIVDNLLYTDSTNKTYRVLEVRALSGINFKSNLVDRTDYNKETGKLLEQLYKESPQDENVLVQMTYQAIREKNLDDAKKFFKLTYQFHKKDFRLYRLGGNLSWKLKDYKTAESSYKKALSFMTDPLDISLMYSTLAQISEEQKNVDQALDYFQRAIKYNEKDAWLYSGYVHYLLKLERWDLAIENGEKMLKIADFGVGRTLLAKAYANKAAQISRYTAGTSDPKADEIKSQYCLLAMKYDDKNFQCLFILSNYYHRTAKKQQDLARAQKAVDYITRTFASGGLTKQEADRFVVLMTSSMKLVASLRNSHSVGGDADEKTNIAEAATATTAVPSATTSPSTTTVLATSRQPASVPSASAPTPAAVVISAATSGAAATANATATTPTTAPALTNRAAASAIATANAVPSQPTPSAPTAAMPAATNNTATAPTTTAATVAAPTTASAAAAPAKPSQATATPPAN
jgi:tetratricopeptide (TPR) repeat protein